MVPANHAGDFGTLRTVGPRVPRGAAQDVTFPFRPVIDDNDVVGEDGRARQGPHLPRDHTSHLRPTAADDRSRILKT